MRDDVMVLYLVCGCMMQEWQDEQLQWDPDEFNGISILRLPCDSIWLPDIVLYNRCVTTAV